MSKMVTWDHHLDSAESQKSLIHKHEWDNLIILDSCRYDAFESRYEQFLNGDLIKVRSEASCTRDWLRLTWTENYPDVTYISSNVFMREKLSKKYVHIQYKRLSAFKKIVDAFMEGLEPEYVNKHALIHSGRKILHYTQPHLPLYGEIKEKTWDGYISNLDHVIKHVVRLLPKIGGRTVITADHGEFMMRAFMFEHPCNKNHVDLRLVPWLENVKVKRE